jgi:hypothetical protein
VNGLAPALPAVQPTSGVAPPPGSPPYGGSGDDTVCDREKLIRFLESNADRAAAWAGVLGVTVANIGPFVRSLTPTVLLYDTRVTNHGFADGRATSLQSVLQAGTAVLVDARGNPVVRCRCGNPLLSPTPTARPTYRGTPWVGFNPTVVVAVNNGATVTVVVESPSSGGGSTPGTGGGSGGSTPGTQPQGEPASPSDVEGLSAVLSECALGDFRIVDVRREPDLPNTFSVRAEVDGVEMLFVYNADNGDITEGDRASAELLTRCGVGGP